MPFLRAFRWAPSGPIGVAGVIIIALVAIVSPHFASQGAANVDVFRANELPSSHHILGTDALGRDLFARLLVASQLSLGLSLVAVAISASIGIPLGALAAVIPAWGRGVILRAIDTMIAFPVLIVAIYAGVVIGTGGTGAVAGIGIAGSFGFARIVSTLALSIGGREYIQAARVVGVGPTRLLFLHILPNIAEVLLIGLAFSISGAIVALSGLSFLGLGIQVPLYDWGSLLTSGVNELYENPAAALGPALAIAIAALSFGFLGEALARATNPLLWTRPNREDQARAGASRDYIRPSSLRNTSAERPLTGDPSHMDLSGRMPLLEVRNLGVTFSGVHGTTVAVADVSFDVYEGEVLGIVGESGSGKSMTSLAIAQLVPYPGVVEGVVKLRGEDLRQLPADRLDKMLGTKIAVVFQDPMSSLNPALTIGVQMTEGVERHLGLGHRKALRLALSRLREVGLAAPESAMTHHPHELSGGMRQRVMIAMGLMHQIDLLIADEPTTALDVTIQAQIMELLDRIHRDRNAAVILITHNFGLVKQSSDRVLVMYAGRVVEEVPTHNLVVSALHPYTRALLAAVPDIRLPGHTHLESIRGQPADPAALPSGCPFHPRCPLAVDRCREERPPLLVREPGRRVACWVANEDLT